jgi:hypothetical protein
MGTKVVSALGGKPAVFFEEKMPWFTDQMISERPLIRVNGRIVEHREFAKLIDNK